MMSALSLADYIVVKCALDKEPITNLQLQGILYYIQGKHLAKFGKPAFADEIEAWEFGPCIPNVYYAFCHYGAMPIVGVDKEGSLDKDLNRKFIDQIIEEKRNAEPWDVITETHRDDGAWSKIFNSVGGYRHCIPKELIQRDFTNSQKSSIFSRCAKTT